MDNIDYWNGAGTYCIIFDNDETIFDDETEFYAEDEWELEGLWSDFCAENNLSEDCLIDIEFVCEDCI